MAGPVLQYEITADDSRLKRVMRSVNSHLRGMERQAAASARRTSAATSRAMGGAGRASGTGPLGAIAAAAKLQQAEEMRRHRMAYRNRQRETRASLTGLAQVGRVAAREEVRLHRMRERNAIREARTRSAAARSFGRGAAGTVKTVGGKVIGIGGTALSMAGVGLAAAVGTGLSSAVSSEEALTRLVVNSRDAGKEAADPIAIRKRVSGAASKTGVSTESLIEGLSAAVAKTGDLDAALGSLDTIATASMATGADPTDLYLLQADAIQKFGIQTDQAADALAMLNAQGKKGAFELRAMAAQAPRVFAAAAAFGFKGMGGLRQMGGLLQVARDVTGSDEQAAFATEAMLRQLTAKAGDLQSGKAFDGRKVEIFQGGDPTKGARNFTDILGDVFVQSKGNAVQLQKVFGEEGIRLIRPFLTEFRSAREKALKDGKDPKKASEAGRKALLGRLDKAANVPGDWEEVQKDAALAAKTTSAQFEMIKTEWKEAIAAEMLPALRELTPHIKELSPKFGDLARKLVELGRNAADAAVWLSENPWSGLGILLGGLLVKEIAAAGISALLTGAFTKVAGAVMAARAAGAVAGGVTAAGSTASTTAAAAAGGGILARAGGLVGKAGGALTGALGAVGGTLAAGGAAAGGLALAGWQGMKLFDETNGFSDFGGDVAKAVSGKDYDEMLKKQGIDPAAGMNAEATAKNTEAATKNVTAADKMDAAATKMSEAAGALAANTNPRRTNPINLR